MYQRDPRTTPYAYDDQITNYSSGSGHASHSGDFSTNGYQSQPGSDHYYTPPTQSMSGVHDAMNPNSPYYRSMTPSLAPTHRYSTNGRDPRYYNAPNYGGPSSPTQPGYTSPTQQYPPNYLPNTDHRQPAIHRTPQPTPQFIPTPSEIAHSYNYTQSLLQSSIPEDPYSSSGGYPGPPHTVSSSPSGHRPRLSTGRPRTGSVGVSSPTLSSPSGERFPCDKCGKTFSRSHDRKRHHETQHDPSHTAHLCPYCDKGFSRNDSLKRHLDNGCDCMHS